MAFTGNYGTIKIKSNAKEVLAASDKQIRTGLTNIGIAAKDNIRKEIMEKNVYDTGETYRTIGYRTNANKKSIVIGAKTNYAPYPELGTPTMAPRPFVSTGIINHISEYQKIMEDALKK